MLSRQAALAEEIALFQDSDDCFLSLMRDDRQLDVTLCDIENSVCCVTLDENRVVNPVFRTLFSTVDVRQEILQIERRFGRSLIGHVRLRIFLLEKITQFNGGFKPI
jgi:hypothetical protein